MEEKCEGVGTGVGICCSCFRVGDSGLDLGVGSGDGEK